MHAGGRPFSIGHIQFLVPFVLWEHLSSLCLFFLMYSSRFGCDVCAPTHIKREKKKGKDFDCDRFFFFFLSTSPTPSLLSFPTLHLLSFPANKQHELIQEPILKDTETTYHFQQHKHHNQRSSRTIPPRHPRNPRTHILLSRRIHPPPLCRICLSSMAPSKSRSTPPQRCLGLFLERGENAHHGCEAGWRCQVLVLLLG